MKIIFFNCSFLHLELKPRRRRSNDNNRYLNDDTDLRSTIRNRTSSRHFNQTSNNDDREYLLDKDYRHPSVFDMLLSLISPDNNSTKKLVDNYDIQQMDIVDDYPIAPPLPPFPPPPPPLPPNHLPFFDPLPPLPPPPPSIFNIFPVNQSTNWPRPNFVQTDLWHPTDVDLRHQPITNHHHIISPQIAEQLPHKKPRQQRRKRSKKHHHERESEPPTVITDHIEISTEQTNNHSLNENVVVGDDDDEEEERLLREELLRTLTNKRKVKVIPPERIVTIIPSNSPPPSLPIVQTNVNPTPVVADKPQYSINQRYKRVKANLSSTNLTTKTETTTTTATVVRTTQPLIQTRNKIVRVVKDYLFSLFYKIYFVSLKPENDMDMPQSNPIIITFDDPTSDEDEQQQSTKQLKESTYVIADEERQAIKRLQQLQEEVIRRVNAVELTNKTVASKPPVPVEVAQEAIPSTDELSALFEKRYEV